MAVILILDEAGGALLDEGGGDIFDETPFPVAPLDLRTEFSIAGAWQDATSLVYQREGTAPPAEIERGRQDETAKFNSSSSTFEVNNRSGQFSPLNPLGTWYGSFSRNTPVRHSIPAASNYLRLEALQARAYVNNDSNLAISGSVDVRIQLSLEDWQGCVLAAKWDGGACWLWWLNPNGTLSWEWADSGDIVHTVTSTVPVPLTRGQFALRATLDVTTGNVTFYTSATIGGTWAQLGGVSSGTGGAATSVQVASGSALVVGYSFNEMTGNNLYGGVAELQVYSGIAGTLVADGVFSAQAAGTTSWSDAQGNLWLMQGGAEISSRDYRFHGECSELPPKWDNTGVDQSVQVTAGGIWRRLGQGQTPAQSPMRRALTTETGTLVPVAYWPCEDAAGAASFGSASGGALMTFDGSPTLASDSSFPGSLPLPQVNGSRWHGRVGTYTSNGAIVVRALVHPGTSGTAGAPIIRVITTGSCMELSALWESSTNLEIVGNAGSTSVFNSGSVNFGGSLPGGTIQQPMWMSLELTPGGGSTVDWALVVLPLGVESGGEQFTGSFTGSIGNVTDVYIDPSAAFTDWGLGHISVQSAWVSMFSLWQPFSAWVGETAAARFARLCGEEGIAARIIGSPAYSAAMGEQGSDTLPNLLQSCEDADQGQIFEPRQVLGLGYRTAASLCNQAPRVTVNYSLAQLGGNSGGSGTGLEPTMDDALLRNDWTVTRGAPGSGGTQGATYQYMLNDGSAESVAVAGDYSDSLTANVEYDTAVPNLAGWKVHTGTAHEYRWPSIPFNLRRNAIQSASLYYPLLSLDVGDYVQLTNMPGVILPDPVKQLSWGLKESLGGYHHQLELNGVPESRYEVLILDDPVYGRVDTDGSSLAAAVSSTATTLSVATTGPSGIVWTQAAGDFPFDIAVGGERMTVTAVSGASSPQTFTVTRSVNGVVKAQSSGADVRLWFPPFLAWQ